jgi:hypothetical protein
MQHINNYKENEELINIEDAFNIFVFQPYNSELNKLRQKLSMGKREQDNNIPNIVPLSPPVNVIKQQNKNSKIKQIGLPKIKPSSPVSIAHNADPWPIQKLSPSSKEFVPYSYKNDHAQKLVQEYHNEVNLPKLKSETTTPTLSFWGDEIGMLQERPNTSREERKKRNLSSKNFIENVIDFHNNHFATKSEHRIKMKN